MFKFEHIGNKETQEDACFCFKDNDVQYYFVLDGHGYDKTQIFIIDFLKKNDFLKNMISLFFKKHIINKKNIELFFKQLDLFLQKKKICSGACLTGAIVDYKENFLYLLNIGDTKYFVFKENKLILESQDHNIKNKKEYARIIKYGKTSFIKFGRYKKISMTRVLGDFDCKTELPNPIIPIPEIISLPLKNLQIILTTDGIKFNYNINTIINLFNLKNDSYDNLIKYCKEVSSNNIKKYKNKKIDNVLFLIIKIEEQKKIFVEPEKPFLHKVLNEHLNIKKCLNEQSKKINERQEDFFIYNCLTTLFE